MNDEGKAQEAAPDFQWNDNPPENVNQMEPMSSEAEKWSIAEIDDKLLSMGNQDAGKKEQDKYSDKFDEDDIVEDIPE